MFTFLKEFKDVSFVKVLKSKSILRRSVEDNILAYLSAISTRDILHLSRKESFLDFPIFSSLFLIDISNAAHWKKSKIHSMNSLRQKITPTGFHEEKLI